MEPHIDLGIQVGRIDGRLDALEGRMNRFESTVSADLKGIKDKLDSISDDLAQKLGERSGYGQVAKTVAWAIGLASGWVYTLLHGHWP